MAQTSFPDPAYNSGALTEREWERNAALFSADGAYGDPTDAALVVAGVGLQVTVRAFRSANVRGYQWYSGATDYTHAIAANTSGSTRVDRVVLRLDRSNWTLRTAIRQGTPGAGMPSLVQDTGDTGVYEIPLATVTILNNASSVTVARAELWLGSRVRPCTSSTRPTVPRRGEIAFETDTGDWIGWTGTTWARLYDYSGSVALGPGYTAWEHYATNRAVARGGVVTLRLAVMRVSGGTFQTVDPDGSMIATVPAGLRPIGIHQYFAAVFHNDALTRIEIRTDGQVWVSPPSKDVPGGTKLVQTCTYTIGEA